jgi:type IV secretory pathway TraG/TraD family ATPase VirD4
MKITLPILGWAFLVAMLISIGLWTWDVTEQFEAWSALPDALSNTFDSPHGQGIALWALVRGFVPVGFTLYMLDQFDDRDRNKRVVRGARVVHQGELTKKTRTKQQQIEIAGVPVPGNCEPSHFLFAGSTGVGKTVATDEVLRHALARGDRVIVVDPNGHALSRFGKKGDVLLNPFDRRAPGWSIFNEYRKPFDFERFAKSVVPDSADAGVQQWHGYAQQLLAEITRAMSQAGETNTERLLYWATQAPAKKLATFLAGTAASGLFEPDAEKALASTRFVLAHYVGVFQHLQPGDFSLRDWLGKSQGNLFITWREDMLLALKPLVSAWVDILVASILTLPDDQPRPLWLVLDELASLERLSSLEAGLTKGRKHGLRVVAGLQSVSQLDALYGLHNAKTLRSCFRNLLALGCSNSDPHTALEISNGLGQCEVERTQTTRSNGKDGSSTSTSLQRTTEPAVLPAELMAVPPLHGYLKFAGDYPIGKIRLVPQDYPVRLQPFIER